VEMQVRLQGKCKHNTVARSCLVNVLLAYGANMK
jgi:hypothetical protein